MRKHFDFYGYNSPTSGKFYVDGCEYFSGEDYRNEKRYREYKATGFNILLLQHENSYSGEEFDGSACHLCMTEAWKAGIKRIIVSDTRLKDLCIEPNLLGEEGKFKDEKEFLEYLDFCTQPYREQKGFFGVQLFDEPEWAHLESYALVCRGLKKILPNIYLQCCLNPPAAKERLGGKGLSSLDAFEEYLKQFIDKTGLDYITYDEYPFRRDYIIGGFSLPSYRIAARVCKEKGVEFHIVLQSWAYMWRAKPDARIQLSPRNMVTADLYWQLNLLMGLGCKEFAFFTYFTKQNVELLNRVNLVVDGGSLVNRDGTRTKLWFDTQKIIREMKKFEPVILRYSYDDSWLFYEEGKTYKDFMQTEYLEETTGCPILVKPQKELALVSRLEREGSALYMVQNVENLKTQQERKTPVAFEIDLGKDFKKVKFYVRGKRVKRKLTDGKFTEYLSCGDAIFIEIFS